MGRLMAIDWGGKRCGIAVSDRLQIIATGLTTVPTKELLDFIKNYLQEEEVECFVVGDPRQADGSHSDASPGADALAKKLAELFPSTAVEREDETNTSRRAMQTLVMGGVPKMKRRNKELLDEVSATLILQSFMERTKD